MNWYKIAQDLPYYYVSLGDEDAPLFIAFIEEKGWGLEKFVRFDGIDMGIYRAEVDKRIEDFKVGAGIAGVSNVVDAIIDINGKKFGMFTLYEFHHERFGKWEWVVYPYIKSISEEQIDESLNQFRRQDF